MQSENHPSIHFECSDYKRLIHSDEARLRNPDQILRGRTTMSKPIHEVRLGLIKAAIWQNQTRVGERHNVTLTRLYRNGDVWKESTHFGRDDLLLAAKVLDLAHSWIYQQDRAERAEKGEAVPDEPR